MLPSQRAVQRVIRQFAKERIGCSDIAFDLGGTWKLRGHLNLLFAGGRDIVGDTSAMGYSFLQSEPRALVECS